MSGTQSTTSTAADEIFDSSSLDIISTSTQDEAAVIPAPALAHLDAVPEALYPILSVQVDEGPFTNKGSFDSRYCKVKKSLYYLYST